MRTTLLPQPSPIRFEHHEPGRLGIGETRPRLSWQYSEAPSDFVQRAVEIELRIERPGQADEVSLHRLDGANQILVPWPGRGLCSRERVNARLRVVDSGRDDLPEHGAWSDPSTVEVGLLDPSDWSASFVGPAWLEPAVDDRRPGRIRVEFDSPDDIVRARLYLSAHGLAEAEINGRRVGDEEFTPGWTSYHHRLRYATFDVTDHLISGVNAIGVWLGDGWWRGRIGFEGGLRDVYGSDLSAIVQLELTRADGSRIVVASGDDWTAGFGPIISSSLYNGETYDARLHDARWSTADGGAAGWSAVTVVGSATDQLVAPTGPPVRCTDELEPVSIERRSSDRWIIDFGQNHSGRLRIRGTGESGDTITMRHAEILEKGELFTRTLRGAEATDRLILDGGSFDWEPKFTIHGFRYAEISGWRGELTPQMVVSRVLHTDMERRGWFSSSDARLNRLHDNVVWSMRSNFVDIPADCPQRDERLGWTGDIQVFAPTAAFIFDVSGILSSWLTDVALEQRDRGTVPFYVPYLPLGSWKDAPVDPVAVWGDVAVLTPDVLYQRTADVDVVKRQYRSAVDWVEQVAARATPEFICEGTMQLGDWLDPAAPPDQPELGTTDPALVATAYFAHSAGRLADMAELLGETRDALRYRLLATNVRRAFANKYLGANGIASDDTQTAYSLATMFSLWPDDARKDIGVDRLAELVRQSDGKISTGFAGTPLIADALTSGGHVDEAYGLLLSEECPSWLYMVSMGATTIWERWDSMLPDGSVNPGDMTSFNHYALGSVSDWMHRVVAGLAPLEPGYRRIEFAPQPGGGLTHAEATHLTPYGLASVAWRLDEDDVTVTVTVPVGATGVIRLPGSQISIEVGHGTHSLTTAQTEIIEPARA